MPSPQTHLIEGEYMSTPDVDSPAFLERAVEGRDAPTRQKLIKYLTTLKKTGCSMTAAAARSKISYNTVIDARARFVEFQILEEIAYNDRVADVDTTVADKAVGGDLGFSALFYKRRGELTERVEIDVKNELPLEAYSPKTRQLMLKDQLSFAAKVKGNK